MFAHRSRAQRWFLAGVAVLVGAVAWHGLRGKDSADARPARRPPAVYRERELADEAPNAVAPLVEVRPPVVIRKTIAPPAGVEGDPGRLEEWLLALPDESFRGLIGTPRLDGYVAAIVAHQDRSERGMASPGRGEFLNRLNERILRLAKDRKP